MFKVYSPPHLVEQANLIEKRNQDQSGLVFATSGTSGEPKWILHSQTGLDWCARQVNTLFGCSSRDSWGLALPDFHVGGYGIIHRARLAGGTLSKFPNKWQASDFAAWLQQEKITIISLVPAQVLDLVSQHITAPPALRLALIGGEHLPANLHEQALALGWPLVISYGMTETAGLIAAANLGETNLHPLPGWELTQTPESLLAIDGPGLFTGYLSPDGFTPTERPFLTKDLVEVSPHSLTLKGRSDDQIKILGELVDLKALRESLTQALPSHQTTILALPDERRNFLLIPVIESESCATLQKKVEDWNQSQPAFVRCLPPVFLTNWARTPLGKTDLRKLTTQVTEERTSLLPNTDSSA